MNIFSKTKYIVFFILSVLVGVGGTILFQGIYELEELELSIARTEANKQVPASPEKLTEGQPKQGLVTQ